MADPFGSFLGLGGSFLLETTLNDDFLVVLIIGFFPTGFL